MSDKVISMMPQLLCKQLARDLGRFLEGDPCASPEKILEQFDAALAAPDEQSPLPPGFILVPQCAGCGVQDRPDSRHTDTCPAYPGQKVRP